MNNCNTINGSRDEKTHTQKKNRKTLYCRKEIRKLMNYYRRDWYPLRE